MQGDQTEKDYIDFNHSINLEKRMIVEWNLNYYYDVVVPPKTDAIYGSGNQEYYFKNWPLESVCKPRRPGTGICKTRFVTKAMASAYGLYWQTSANLNTLSNTNFWTYNSGGGYYVPKPRVYYNRKNQKYKYFTQEKRPNESGYNHPAVVYTTALSMNKIVIGFEITMGKPGNFTIQTSPNGSSYSTIFTGTYSNIDAEGRLTIYWNGSTWTTSAPSSPDIGTISTNIKAIKVAVTGMVNNSNASDPSAYMNLIEISPRIEHDVSSIVRDFTYDNNFSENDAITPIGTVSSASGTIVLDNTDYAIENTNPSGFNLGSLAKKYAKFSCSIRRAGGSTWYRQFTCYADDWKGSGNGDSYSIPLLDTAKFLQDEPSPEILINNVTVSASIWRLLDSAGYSNFVVRSASGEVEPVIDWFYTNSDATIWDSIKEICQIHQYSVYVDEYDVINICTKGWLYTAKTSAWSFRDVVSGSSLPNYSNVENSTTEPINYAIVKYKPQATSSEVDPGYLLPKGGVSYERMANQSLYRPDTADSILLGVADLVGDIPATFTVGQEWIRINPTSFNEFNWGHYAGYALVDTEIMKFDGAEFSYTIKGGGTTATSIAKNNGEYSQIRAKASGVIRFTGRLMNVERAQFGTTAASHSSGIGTGPTGWTLSDPLYMKLNKDATGQGYFLIHSSAAAVDTLCTATKTFSGSGYSTVRMKIGPGGAAVNGAGIVKWAKLLGSNRISSGVYVEVRKMAVDNGLANVTIWRVANGAVYPTILDQATVHLKYNEYFYLSVYESMATSSSFDIRAYFNGAKVANALISTSSVPRSSAFALTARGHAFAAFDFASGSPSKYSNLEQYYMHSFAGQLGNILNTNRGQVESSYMTSLDAVGLETFDRKVRAVDVQNVRFVAGPAITAHYYGTPQMVMPVVDGRYTGSSADIASAVVVTSPFEATYAVANVADQSLRLESLDGKTYPFIYGLIVMEYPEVKREKKNEGSIRRIGEKKLDISPKWVTNMTSADNLCDWLVTKWNNGITTLTVDSFSNHLVQLGDTVTVICSAKNIISSRKFVVTSISKSWNTGLENKFVLVEVT